MHSYSFDADRPPPYSEDPEPSLTASRKSREKGGKKKAKSKWADFNFPWQVRILAWFLLIAGIAASVAFTTFYGVSFGDAACKQWLSSLFFSFFLDLCLTQPVKVSLFS